MTNNFKDYINYFRSLCVSHYAIQHDPSTELDSTEQKNACRFFQFTQNDVVEGIRAAMSEEVCLFLEPYEFRGKDNEAGDYRADHTARFVISAKRNSFLPENKQYDRVELLTFTEEITWAFINKILFDSNESGPACGTPFSGLTLNNFFNIEPQIQIFDDRYGWLVEFNYQQRRNAVMNKSIATDNATWL